MSGSCLTIIGNVIHKEEAIVHAMQLVELQFALKLVPWRYKPLDMQEVTKPKLVEILCETLQLDWTNTDNG